MEKLCPIHGLPLERGQARYTAATIWHCPEGHDYREHQDEEA